MASVNREQLGEWLSAYLDGELTSEESARVAQLLRDNAEARQLLAEMRAVSELVGALPRRSAPESILEDVQRHLERDELIGDSEQSPSASGGGPRLRHLATAAMIGLVVIGGGWLYTAVTRPGGLGDTVVFDPPTGDTRPGMLSEGLTPAASSEGSGASAKDESSHGPPAAQAPPAAPRGGGSVATRSASPAVSSDPTKPDKTTLGREVDTPSRRKDAPASRGTPPGEPLPGAASRGAVAADATRSEARDMIDGGRVQVGDVAPVLGHLRSMGYLGDDDEDPAEKKYLTAVASRAQLDQKLAASVPATELMSHDFALEGNSIQLALDETVEVDAVNRQLHDYLARRDVVNLQGEAAAAGDELANQAFYFEGAAGRNYAGAGERQMIVRLPVEEVSSLVTELTERVASDEATAMQVGPIVARGRRGVTALARQVAGQEVVEAAQAAQAEFGQDDRAPAAPHGADEESAASELATGLAAEAEQVDALIEMLGLKTKAGAARSDAPAQNAKEAAGTSVAAGSPTEGPPQAPAAAKSTSAAESKSEPSGKTEEPADTEARPQSLTQRRLAMLDKSAAPQPEQKQVERVEAPAEGGGPSGEEPERFARKRAAGDEATSPAALDRELQTGMRFGAHTQPQESHRAEARGQTSRGFVTLVIRLMAAPAEADKAVEDPARTGHAGGAGAAGRPASKPSTDDPHGGKPASPPEHR